VGGRQGGKGLSLGVAEREQLDCAAGNFVCVVDAGRSGEGRWGGGHVECIKGRRLETNTKFNQFDLKLTKIKQSAPQL
jgi:hypothetical protein